MKDIRIGLIGLDTSHVEDFAALINDCSNPDHVSGATIVAAYPGGSSDFPLSINRVATYTRKLREQYQVTILDTNEAVAEASDAILLTSVDVRVHLSQFSSIAAYCRPVYVNKPFASNLAEAQKMVAIAHRHSIPLFSSSSLRFAGALQAAIADTSAGPVKGANFYGPLPFEPTQAGYFWYGVHLAEMLFATMGPNCRSVQAIARSDSDLVVGVWQDGRVATWACLEKVDTNSGGFDVL